MEKTVDTLVPGEVLLVDAKGVSGGKIMLQYAEIISNPNATSSNPLVAAFNASDPRFKSRARRAWQSVEKSDAEKLLGIKLGDMEKGDVKELNILNPKVNGSSIKIQITETTKPDEYQKENIKTTAKRAGPDGDFIKHGGAFIFSNTEPIPEELRKHTFLTADPSEEVPAEAETEAKAEVSVDELTA